MKQLPSPLRQFDEWTNVPNIVFDKLMRECDPIVFKVLCIFIRKTYGFHKDRDSISKTQLMEISGLSSSSITRATNALTKSGMLIITKEGNRHKKECREWKLDTEV